MTATSDSATPRRLRPRAAIILAVTVLTLVALIALSASALAYGSTVREGEQLLPGTTVASVDVGEISVEEAVVAVRTAVEPRLERTLTVTYGDQRWETTPSALGVTADVEAAVADAAAEADDLGFTDLVRLRWLGSDSGLDVDVPMAVAEEQVEAFVAGLAEELDRDPHDATVEWVDGDVAVTEEGYDGREVQQAAAVEALLAAATGDASELELPVETSTPTVTTDTAEQVAADVGAAVDAALDRAITVSLDERAETITGRELGATPDLEPLLAAAFDDADSLPDVDLHVADDAVGAVVDEVTAGSVVAPRDATIDTSGGSFSITPERTGAAVDRGEAVAEVQAALDGAADRVELELRTLQPTITAASFDEIILVDHSSTTVTLVRGGEPVKSWPVAVGTNNSPTPTGTFVVGAKRFEPTWTNPAKDRWGKDMPDRIGPGPNNPLGLRAINWNTTAGRDTLIRFHGTPNEDSIGTAASNGCVRMFNQHVVELYDMVSTGMTIVSQH